MYVRMSYWKCKPEYWGEDAKLFKSGAVPIMQTHAGFVRAMLLATPEDTQRIAFTVWADREGYDAFVDSPDLQHIIDMFEHMYLPDGNPDPVEYDVRAQGGGA